MRELFECSWFECSFVLTEQMIQERRKKIRAAVSFMTYPEKSNIDISTIFYWFHRSIVFSQHGRGLYMGTDTRRQRAWGEVSWRMTITDTKFSTYATDVP